MKKRGLLLIGIMLFATLTIFSIPLQGTATPTPITAKYGTATLSTLDRLIEIINSTGRNYQINSTAVRTDLTPLRYTFTNTTKITKTASIVDSHFDNESYKDGFNNTFATMTNITVINNNTIELDTYNESATYYNNSYSTFYSEHYTENYTNEYTNFTGNEESSDDVTVNEDSVVLDFIESDGYYISKNITISANNVTIKDVSWVETISAGDITIECFDFNTSAWVNIASFINTVQTKFKYRANFTAYDPGNTSSVTLNKVILEYYEHIYNVSKKFEYNFDIDKANILTFYFNISVTTNKTANIWLYDYIITDYRIPGLPEKKLDYYGDYGLVLWKINRTELGVGNGFYIDVAFVNITITYDSYKSSGLYISDEYTLRHTVLVNNFTSDYFGDINISLAFKNISGGWTSFNHYTSQIDVIAKQIKFQLNLTSNQYNNTPVFYDLSVNYTYYTHLLEQNFSKQFLFPHDSLINFTLNVFGNSSDSLAGAVLWIFNYSINGFKKVGPVTDSIVLQTYTNDSRFFSVNREFLWKINGTLDGYLGFSITQQNYSIEYVRYVFDRQVYCLRVPLKNSNYLWFSVETQFTSSDALFKIYFDSNVVVTHTNTTSGIQVYNFLSLGHDAGLVDNMDFYFIINNASEYNKGGSIKISDVYIWESEFNIWEILLELWGLVPIDSYWAWIIVGIVAAGSGVAAIVLYYYYKNRSNGSKRVEMTRIRI